MAARSIPAGEAVSLAWRAAERGNNSGADDGLGKSEQPVGVVAQGDLA